MLQSLILFFISFKLTNQVIHIHKKDKNVLILYHQLVNVKLHLRKLRPTLLSTLQANSNIKKGILWIHIYDVHDKKKDKSKLSMNKRTTNVLNSCHVIAYVCWILERVKIKQHCGTEVCLVGVINDRHCNFF